MIYVLIVLGVIARLVPHLPNFVPIGAIGIYLSSRYGYLKAGAGVLAIMIITDIFIGFSYASIYVYLGMLAYVFWALLIKKSRLGYLGAPIGGSVTFFLITNLGVWLGPWYSHDMPGFIRCFTLAIPFYKFTLASDIIFTAAIFTVAFLIKKINFKEGPWLKRFPKVSLKQR